MAQVRYSKTIPEPDKVLATISQCRATLIAAASKVRPTGPAYHAIHMVTATFMTGERDYFSMRLRGEQPFPNAAPGLDLDESPHADHAEFARYKPKD